MSLQRLIIIAIALWPTCAMARHDDRQRQVDAARIAAQAKIVEMIAEEPLGNGVTVGAYLDRMGARRKLWQTVAAARQVGSARWIDDGTCQVRVEVEAVEVGQLILDTALAAPAKSPLSYGLLERKTAQWNKRSFSATAGSLAADRATLVEPPAGRSEWSKVNQAERRALIETARHNAGVRLVDSFADEQAIDESGRSRLLEWASSQPVTAVHFRDDRAVDVTIAYNSTELIGVLKDAVPGNAVDSVTSQIESSPSTVTGRSYGPSDASRPQVVVIPTQPPGWASELIDVSAEAMFKSSALKTARLADDAAQRLLRDKVGSLALSDGTILSEHASEDRSIAEAIDRAVSASRVAKVEYRADGSVGVRLVLPGKTVWNELTAVTGSR